MPKKFEKKFLVSRRHVAEWPWHSLTALDWIEFSKILNKEHAVPPSPRFFWTANQNAQRPAAAQLVSFHIINQFTVLTVSNKTFSLYSRTNVITRDAMSLATQGGRRTRGRGCGTSWYVYNLRLQEQRGGETRSSLWNLYFHSPAVNTTSIVIQG